MSQNPLQQLVATWPIFGQDVVILFIFCKIQSHLPSIYEDVFAPDLH